MLMLAVGLVMTVRVIRQEVALNELQAKFVAAVSHELKSPLTGIRLLMERMAGGRLKAPEETREYYAAIGRETDRLESLVSRLLESQAIQSERRKYDFAPASLDEIAGSAIQRLRPQAEAKGIRLAAQADAGVPHLPLDKTAIGDAIENLLDNAIKYSPPEQKSRFRFAPQGTKRASKSRIRESVSRKSISRGSSIRFTADAAGIWRASKARGSGWPW